MKKRLNPDNDENYKIFVLHAAEILRVEANWAAVKQAILALRQQNIVELQQKLAALMRNLAVTWALDDPTHKERTIEPLLSAFDDYIQESKGNAVPGVKDDTFKHHPFIIEKFQFYAAQINEENNHDIINQFTNWWKNDGPEGGYQQYMEAMRQPTDPRQPLQYADDLLLQPLAKGLQVNLDVMLENKVTGQAVRHNICVEHYGRMPIKTLVDEFRLNAEQIQKLSDSGIVSPVMSSEEELKLLPATTESLVALSDMSNNMNAAWEEYYKPAPVITLANPEAKHWDNVLPDIREETLKLAEQWHVTKVQNHYKKMIEDLKKEDKADDVPADKNVSYQVSDDESILVSKQRQEKLDEAYAKQLQLEEYEGFLSEKNAHQRRKKERKNFADEVSSNDVDNKGPKRRKIF